MEKARLEAFLSAVPGEYCGWGNDGSVVYSQGFCDVLGLAHIDSINDIQSVLSPEDSAGLEGLFERLKTEGISFTINVQNRAENKTFKLSGTCGQDLSASDHFYILWLEDITHMKSASDIMEEEHSFLREDVDRLQDSLDALPNPVWIRDEKQNITWCNVCYAKAVDSPPSTIIAQQKELISSARKRKPSDKDLVFGAALAKLALEKDAVQVTKMHEVVGGDRVLLKISEIPVKSRKITVGIAEDITEEERITSEVKGNREATRGLLEQLRSGIAIFKGDERLDFYNTAFAALWDLEDGWLNTRPTLADIMEKLRETRRLPEQADFRVFKKSWLNMFTGLIEPKEDMLYLPDGKALRMLVVPHKLGGIIMTFEDVTSRLELESSYNTLIAVQKETLDNLAEGVAVYGGDGRLKLWNPAFGRLWALDPETLEGEPHVTKVVQRIEKLFTKEKWPATKELLISLALDRSMNEGRLKRTDNTLLEFSTVPLPDGGVLTTYSDMTDTVRVENALREKNAALETAEQLKLDFLANVSYQLRTPLSAIMGFNEMLDQEFFGPLNEKQKEYTHDIHAASQRLLNLINDILDLSSIEAGQMDLDFKETAIKTMMESIQNLVEDWARKQNVEISLKCPANIGKADIDEARVKQVIINLVRNSLANMDDNGHIEMKAGRKGDSVFISVTDNGVGISETEQERILQPFERIDVAGQDTRGAGLGLSLVHNITKLHGGTFELESNLGKGTTITLLLPRSHS